MNAYLWKSNHCVKNTVGIQLSACLRPGEVVHTVQRQQFWAVVSNCSSKFKVQHHSFQLCDLDTHIISLSLSFKHYLRCSSIMRTKKKYKYKYKRRKYTSTQFLINTCPLSSSPHPKYMRSQINGQVINTTSFQGKERYLGPGVAREREDRI